MKRILAAASALVLSAGTCLAAEYQNYSCVNPEEANTTCSYNPAPMERLGAKVKISARLQYPSPLPGKQFTDDYEIVVNCSEGTYKVASAQRTHTGMEPARLIFRQIVDKEMLGSPFAGLYDTACKPAVAKGKKK